MWNTKQIDEIRGWLDRMIERQIMGVRLYFRSGAISEPIDDFSLADGSESVAESIVRNAYDNAVGAGGGVACFVLKAFRNGNDSRAEATRAFSVAAESDHDPEAAGVLGTGTDSVVKLLQQMVIHQNHVITRVVPASLAETTRIIAAQSQAATGMFESVQRAIDIQATAHVESKKLDLEAAEKNERAQRLDKLIEMGLPMLLQYLQDSAKAKALPEPQETPREIPATTDKDPSP